MITTATSPRQPDFRERRLLHVLIAAVGVWWLVLAIAPRYRYDWCLENILVLAAALYLVASYRRLAMSDLSYLLIAIFTTLHLYGAHYTYSETPLGFWLGEQFGFSRNHYDRVVHFSFGLLLFYPLRELLMRAAKLRGGWSYGLALAICMAISESYELVEWVTAQIVDPEAAMAFLGTQGDVFDAQKDTALAAVGALTALALTAGLSRRAGRPRVLR